MECRNRRFISEILQEDVRIAEFKIDFRVRMRLQPFQICWEGQIRPFTMMLIGRAIVQIHRRQNNANQRPLILEEHLPSFKSMTQFTLNL